MEKKKTLSSYKPEYWGKEGGGGVTGHRLKTGQQPGINGIRRGRNGENRINWQNVIMFCNISITLGGWGHKGKCDVQHRMIDIPASTPSSLPPFESPQESFRDYCQTRQRVQAVSLFSYALYKVRRSEEA